MNDVSVKVEVADSLFTLKVRSEDEHSVKQAVELINQKISEFETNYGIKDKKDVLAMVTLQLVSQLGMEKDQAKNELSTLKQVLSDVEQMLILHSQSTEQIGD